MDVSTFAEVVMGSASKGGRISLRDLDTRLSLMGLDELARAAAALYNSRKAKKQALQGPTHPWF